MTLKEGNLWYKFQCPSCYGNRLVYSFHSAMVLRYETHTMLCNGMKCIPVLILKSQRHTFSQTNNFSQINKFFVNYNKMVLSLSDIRACIGSRYVIYHPFVVKLPPNL